MKNKLKKMLLLGLLLTFILSLTGCAEEPLNFEVNETTMQKCTKDIIEKYKEVSDIEEDYYLTSGTELEQTAVKGFLAADSTDHVGRFLDYVSGDGATEVSNGVDGKVVFTQYCKYEHRKVAVKVSYRENKGFALSKEKLYNDLSNQASQYGMDVTDYVVQMYGSYEELDLSSMDAFLDSYLAAAYSEYPYIAEDCEVSAVYSKKELIGKAGVNTAIGMGVVFAVLIFISFVISLLKYIPMIFDADIRKNRAEKKKAQENAQKNTEKRIIAASDVDEKAAKAAKADKPAPKAAADLSEDLMNDAELVAVITAAIYAASGSGVRAPAYTASNDKLVVRSIRRAKR